MRVSNKMCCNVCHEVPFHSMLLMSIQNDTKHRRARKNGTETA